MQQTATPLLWDLRPGRDRAEAGSVVLLPHAGGSANYFLSWEPEIRGDVEVYAVQYPGRGARLAEPYSAHLEDTAAELGAELQRIEGPHVLVGHSLGALIAYELLRGEYGVSPVGLVASAARAPQAPTIYGSPSAVPRDNDLMESMGQWGGLPSVVLDNPDLLELTLAPVEADLVMLERYATQRPTATASVDCPIVAISGAVDPLVDHDHVRGWHEVTTASCDIKTYPGGHFPEGAAISMITSAINQTLPT